MTTSSSSVREDSSSSYSFNIVEYNEDPNNSQPENQDHSPSSNVFNHHHVKIKEYNINEKGRQRTLSSTKIESTSGRTKTINANKFCSFLQKIKLILYDLFLPINYPKSVREGYISYQIYDSIQGLCSYLRGVISNSSLLKAAGVGNSNATAISAAMTWAMKDGIGMVGGLVFSYIYSSKFDSYIKEFRLFADIVNDVAMTLDMISPYYSSYWLVYITGISTICKTMCGMSAGATKGCITQHFAIQGNMADLNAKEGTQETLVSLIGMILGIYLASYLHHLETGENDAKNENEQQEAITYKLSFVISWVVFVVLTIIHVWANYVGVKILKLKTLNQQRAVVALEGIINNVVHETITKTTIRNNVSNNGNVNVISWKVDDYIKRPTEINESLLSSTYRLLSPYYVTRIRLGCTLEYTLSLHGNTNTATTNSNAAATAYYLMNEFANENYIIGIVDQSSKKEMSSSSLPGGRQHVIIKNVPIIAVTLRIGSTDIDELKSFLHAQILHEYFVARRRRRKIHTTSLNDNDDDDDDKIIGENSYQYDTNELISITHQQVNMLFGDTNRFAKKGSTFTINQNRNDNVDKNILSLDKLSSFDWDVQSRLYLGFGKYRAQWQQQQQSQEKKSN